MEKVKIAILTNGRYKPIGSFIRNYIEYLPFNKIVLFGGLIPYFYMGTSLKKQKALRYWYTLLSLNSQKKLEKILKKRLRKILEKEKIDCVFAEFMNTGAFVRETCQELNIPIVTNVLGYEINNTESFNFFLNDYKKLAHYDSTVIPVSKIMIDKLVNIGFRNDQIIYSPLGAREEFFKIEPNYNSQTFIAIGRFVRKKSPLSTIKAFNMVLKDFPHAKLIFAGDGELFEDAKNLVFELGINNSVEFLGWISPHQQISLFSKSSIFLQHSVSTEDGDAEGTPVVIIEASAAGLAIVSTKHAGIIDVVIDNETGFLVEENDWKEMGLKMIYFLNNPNKIKKMGENGKKFIQDNFSMKKHIEYTQSAILNQLNKKS